MTDVALPLSLEDANALLSKSPLAAIRLLTWDSSKRLATFEVFHDEWPKMVFGLLQFGGVDYLQCPTQMDWGYALRLSAEVPLPSRSDEDAGELVFEFFNDIFPSCFVVAETLTCVLADPV